MSDDSIVMFGFSILCIFFLLLGIILYRIDAAIQALCYFKNGGIYLVKNGRRLADDTPEDRRRWPDGWGAFDRPFLPDVSLFFYCFTSHEIAAEEHTYEPVRHPGSCHGGALQLPHGGAVRIGRMARALLGQEPVRAQLLLHGSFASTGEGHGTHQALVAGLLGLPRPTAGSQTASVWPGSGAVLLLRHLRPAGRPPQQRPSSVLRMPGGQLEVGPPPLGAGASGSFRWMDCTPPSAGSCPPWWSTTPISPAASVRSPACWHGRGLNVATLQLNPGGRAAAPSWSSVRPAHPRGRRPGRAGPARHPAGHPLHPGRTGGAPFDRL